MTIALKTFSLWQPWASLVAHGHKRIETRSWRCPLRPGTIVAIHAAKKWSGDLADLCASDPFFEAVRSMGLDPLADKPAFPFGAAVCLARMGDCISTTEALLRPGLVDDREGRFGDYSAGRFAWLFGEVVPLASPLPLRGQQGIWVWDAPEELLPGVERLTAGRERA